MEPRGLDELREHLLKTGPSEDEMKLLNVIAIMENTIENLSRETVGIDFYLEFERIIEDEIGAMLAACQGRMH